MPELQDDRSILSTIELHTECGVNRHACRNNLHSWQTGMLLNSLCTWLELLITRYSLCGADGSAFMSSSLDHWKFINENTETRGKNEINEKNY